MHNNNPYLFAFLLLLTSFGICNYSHAQSTNQTAPPQTPISTPAPQTSPATTPITTSGRPVIPNIPEFRNADILKSVWRESPEMLTKCQQQGIDYRSCVINTMQQENASPQAVIFYQKTGGFANKIRKFKHVYVVYAGIPAADHSDGYFLVTTHGDFIDVDDSTILEKIDISTAPLYSCLKRIYPSAMLWPGNHQFPEIITANHIQRFIFEYPIKDGCNACATAGSAKIAFDFNDVGNFLGVKLLRVNVEGPEQS